MVTQRTVGHVVQLCEFQQLHAADAGRRPQVIHDRIGFVESFRRNDVLVGDAFVLVGWCRAVAMKPDVMLPRNFAKFLIKRHIDFSSLYRLSRLSCSFSNASNSALKLPLPKLFAPL